MGYGTIAMILIRLDAREGDWVTLPELAEHLAMQPETLADELEQLVADGMVRVERDLVWGTITRARIDLAGTHGLRGEVPAMEPYSWGRGR